MLYVVINASLGDIMPRIDDRALPDADKRHALSLTYLYTIFSFGYYVAFAPIFMLYAHQWSMGWAHVAFALAVASLFVHLHTTGKPKVASYGVCTLAASMVLAMALTGGINHTGIYFVMPVTILLFFLPNRRYSMAWIGFMFVTLTAALLLSVGGYMVLPYPNDNVALFLATFVSSVGLLVIYAWEKDKLDYKLNRSLKEIRLLARSLEQEKALVEQKVALRTQQYRKEHAKLEASIESLQIGFIIFDKSLSVLSINDAGKRIILSGSDKGKARVLPETMTTSEVISSLGGAYDLVAKVTHCMHAKRSVANRDVKFGSRYIAVTVTPVIDGRVAVGAVVLIEDTTDSKALERSRDEFFSIASHELRTPLTSIVGNASIARQYYDKLDDKEVKGMLGDIDSSGKRLIAIVNDFLDVSSIEQNKILLKLEQVDIKALTSEVISEMKDMAHSKHLDLRIDPSSASPALVMADRNRLKQIIINLIGNAVKYTDQGSITVNFTPTEHHMLNISVTDTGKGIPTESQYLLFRKFQQASNNILTRDNSQSTGLGLYISKMLAKSMKGDVTLTRSAPGEGSTFTITLPRPEHKE